MAALHILSLVSINQDDYEQAIALAQIGLDICRKVGDRHRQVTFENILASFYLATEQADEAMIHLKEAVVLFAEISKDSDRL